MDYRDRAARMGEAGGAFPPDAKFDEERMVVSVMLWSEDEEAVEEEHDISVRFEACPTCDGRGKYVNPSIDSHGISSEEWACEWDEDEREAYVQGAYDIRCGECKGRRVVPVPCNVDDPVVKRVGRCMREREAIEAEHAAERRMGA